MISSGERLSFILDPVTYMAYNSFLLKELYFLYITTELYFLL